MSPIPVLCPQCLQLKGVLQEKASAIAHVDYYLCSDCHYVWAGRKSNTEAITPVKIVRLN